MGIGVENEPGIEAKCLEYPNHKSKRESHLNIDNSEIFDTQIWTPNQRCDQLPAGSKRHLPITHPP